jgi:hypothetical protein
MAFKALNNTTGIKGIVFILLVYSTLPRLSKYNTPSSTIL